MTMASLNIFLALLLATCCTQCCDSMAIGIPKSAESSRSSTLPRLPSNVDKITARRTPGAMAMASETIHSTANNEYKHHVGEPKSKSSAAKVALSIMCALTILTSSPLPSNAGFGSGGAAVISFPEIKALPTEDYLKLSPSKQRQLQFSVSCKGSTSCETGANRLYEEVKLFNAKPRDEEKLQDELAELEELALARLEVQSSPGNTQQLEQLLKLQTDMFAQLGKQPAWVSYLAALVGSTVSTLVMHPVDTIKVQMMNNNKRSEEDEDIGDGGEFETALSLANAYKGILANVVKEAPSSALYLGIYEIARTYLATTSLGGEPLLIYLLAGATGEFFASWFRAPAEAVKTRLQLGSIGEDGMKLTPLTAAKQVFFSQSGRENLLSSWSTSLIRDIPMGATQLAIFESAKTFVISSATINLDVGAISSEALFGCIGGGIAAFITTPADVITTISINRLSDENLAHYRGKTPIEVLQMLNAEGGLAAVFTGWKERTIYWTPAIGIFLSIYCSSRQFALSVL
mmetsp:Transcript_9213/g.13937  ORF Transcript_9213/g.13937 Transcript_9213/m.13937 type:complete len:518 (+) Transcript_9213:221-1774(+)